MSEKTDKSEESINIIVNYPFLKHEECFSIPIESAYSDIVSKIYEEIGAEEDSDRHDKVYSNVVSISLLDPGGYIYIPIQKEFGIDINNNNKPISDSVGIIPLKNEALVTCSRFTDIFSPRRPINLLIQQIIQDYAYIGVCVAGGVIDYDTRYAELFHDFYTHHGSVFKDQFILATAPFYYFGHRNMSASSNKLTNYSDRMKKCIKLPVHLNINDGNAYYRSIYFGLFEQIIAGKNIHLFGLIAEIFRDSGHHTHIYQYDSSSGVEVEVMMDEDADFQELLTTLELASNGVIWNTIEELEYDILCEDEDNTLDYSCIQAMRCMTSCYIRKHAHLSSSDRATVELNVEGKDMVAPTLESILINSKYYHGCDAHFMNDPVSSSCNDLDSVSGYGHNAAAGGGVHEPVHLMSSIDEYCSIYVEKMHVEAADAVIELGLVPLALKCACSLQRVVVSQSTASFHREKKSKKSKKREYELRSVSTAIQKVCNGVRNRNVDKMEAEANLATEQRGPEVHGAGEKAPGLGQTNTNTKTDSFTSISTAGGGGNTHAFAVRDMMSDRLVQWKPPVDTVCDLYGFIHIYQYEYWLLTNSHEDKKEWKRNKVMEIADAVAKKTHMKEEAYVHPDAPQGLHNYKLAADRGHTDAQYQLALCYDMGLEGVHESKIQALKYYKLAADSGHTDSQYQLGLIYDLGIPGVPENKLVAIRYYKLAADKGNVDAIHMLLSYGVNITRSGNTSSKTAKQRRCCMRKLHGIMYPLGYFDHASYKHIHPKAGVTVTPPAQDIKKNGTQIVSPPGVQKKNSDVTRNNKVVSVTSLKGSKEDAGMVHRSLSDNSAVFISPSAAKMNANARPPISTAASAGNLTGGVASGGVGNLNNENLSIEVPRTPPVGNFSFGDVVCATSNGTWSQSPGRDSKTNTLRKTVHSAMEKMKKMKKKDSSIPETFETFIVTPTIKTSTPSVNVLNVEDTIVDGGTTTTPNAAVNAIKPPRLLNQFSTNAMKISSSTVATTAVSTSTTDVNDPNDEGDSTWTPQKSKDVNDPNETPRMRHDDIHKEFDQGQVQDQRLTPPPSPMMRQFTWKQARPEDRVDGEDEFSVDEQTDEYDSSSGLDFDSDSDWDLEIEEPDESVVSEWMVSEQGEHIPRHPYVKFFIHNYKILSACCRHIANSHIFQYFIFINIIVAGLIVGIQSYPAFDAYANIFELANRVILGAFSLEVVVKLVGEEFKPWYYFVDRHYKLNKWNIFDFTIVFLSILFVSISSSSNDSGSKFQFLRVVRVLRFTKLFKRIPQLNMIIRGLTDSVSFLSYITLLWTLVIFMYAVFGLLIFADNDPWHFRSIEYAMLTLFQMTVLDFWGEVLYVNFYGCDEYPSVFYTDDPSLGGSVIGTLMYCEHPEANPGYAVTYFVSYIILTSFCIVPLFVAAVFISMSDCVEEMKERSKASYRKRCIRQLERKYQMMLHPYSMSSETKLSTKLLRIGFSGGDITKDIALFDEDKVESISEIDHNGTLSELIVKKPSLNSFQYFMYYYHILAYKCGEFVEYAFVRKLIIINIVLAGCVVGLQTDVRVNADHADALHTLNLIVQIAFAIEVILKIIAEAEHPWMYFTTSWNIFDFIIVFVSFIPISNTSSLVIVRLVKLFRVMKITKELRQLQVVFAGATKGGSAALYILMVLFIVYYVFAIVANTLFADNDPASWGTLHIGMLVLTQLATLDQWSSYANTIIFGCASQPSPLMFDDSQCSHSSGQFLFGFIFLAAFTIFGSYILLALFVGCIHIAMEEEQIELMDEERILRCVRRIKKERGISSLVVARYLKIFKLLDVTYDNRLGIEEVQFGLRVAGEELDDEEFMTLFHTVDEDDSGAIDFGEFVLFMLNMRTLTLGRIEIEKELEKLDSDSDSDDEEEDVSDVAFTFSDADIFNSHKSQSHSQPMSGSSSPRKSGKSASAKKQKRQSISAIGLSLEMKKANVEVEGQSSNLLRNFKDELGSPKNNKEKRNSTQFSKNNSISKNITLPPPPPPTDAVKQRMTLMKENSLIKPIVNKPYQPKVIGENKHLQRKASMANLLTKIAEDGQEDRKKIFRKDSKSKLLRVESYTDLLTKVGSEDKNNKDIRKHRVQKIVLNSISPVTSPHSKSSKSKSMKSPKHSFRGFGDSIYGLSSKLLHSQSEDLFEKDDSDDEQHIRIRNHVLNNKKLGHHFD